MDVLAVLVLFGALALAAPAWGADSREILRRRDDALAQLRTWW